MRVRGRRILELRQWIAFETIGATLKNEELGLECFEMRLNTRPGLHELGIAGKRRQLYIEFGAFCPALACFIFPTRTGIKRAPILVYIRKNQVGVVLERVKHTIAVVHVDIQVTDAADAIHAAQGFDHYSEVVEHTEPGGVTASRMVESADRLQAAQAMPVHHLRQPIQGRSDDMGRGAVHAGKHRRITVVEQSKTPFLGGKHQLYVVVAMKADQLLMQRFTRRALGSVSDQTPFNCFP